MFFIENKIGLHLICEDGAKRRESWLACSVRLDRTWDWKIVFTGIGIPIDRWAS
jgi:hypothetical protein